MRQRALGVVLATASAIALAAGCGRSVTISPKLDDDGAGGDGASGGAGGSGGSPCGPEACDGIDNNCDGQIDEGCACQPGQAQACYSGDPSTLGVGACAAGVQACGADGQWGPCQGEITPSPEVCDGIDNSCDGQTDEALGVQTCGIGPCQVTVPVCQNGAPAPCVPGPPGTEVCDGLDNDCDGFVDESDPIVGTPCSTGLPGVCDAGIYQCAGGAVQCAESQPPGPEACDGIDNDCNGQADEGDPGGGGACVTGLPGVCSPGTLHCNAGALACVASQPPQPEICDGLDNDCDGLVDAAPCACGVATCVGGQLVCGGGPAIYFQDTFASNAAGWTLDSTWQIGPTSVSSGQVFGFPDPALDHTASADNGVAGVVLGGNAPINLHPLYYLTSPPFDTSGPGSAYFQYWRYLNSDYQPFMNNVVQVYNGSTWVTLWQSGGPPGIQDSAWQKVVFDITPYKSASTRVRFGYSVDSQGVFTVASWSVDDVVISSAPCP